MTINSQEIFTPSRANVYVAPTGTAAPADSAVALDPAWINVGLITTDSLQFTTAPEFGEVQSYQSDFPTKRFQTVESATVTVELQQWNAANLVAAYGGGAVTEPDAATAPGQYKFTPPAFGARDEKSVIIEAIDSIKHLRIVFPRVMQTEGVQMSIQKGQEARLPLQFAVLGDDAADPFYMLSDDAAWAPPGP